MALRASATESPIVPNEARSHDVLETLVSMEDIMFKRSKPVLALVAFLSSIAFSMQPGSAEEPGIRHRVFMAGSVIEATARSVYLCIGTAEGAEVSQVLDVVRIRRERTANPKAGVRFRRDKVATVKIEAIVDEHFARASVINGRAKKGDIVRLSGDER